MKAVRVNKFVEVRFAKHTDNKLLKADAVERAMDINVF